MSLNFAIVDSFLKENGDAMRDKTLLRHERGRILGELRDRLEGSLREYEAFEAEFRSLVTERIEKAAAVDELSRLHRRAVAGVEKYFLEEDNVADVHDLLRIVRDNITAGVLRLVEAEMERDGYGYPPTPYVWVGLGSEGRDEQTMVTDQDNMLIFGEDADEDAFRRYLIDQCEEHYRDMGVGDGFEKKRTSKTIIEFYYRIFSEKAVERLHEVGFEKCSGNVMPSNLKWRGSLKDWRERLDQRLVFGRGIFEDLDVIILTDARYIAGDKPLLHDFLGAFFRYLTGNKHMMKDFIESAVLMPTALSFFGNFKVEKTGGHKDMFNLKLHGWAPLILAVRMLALSNGIFDPNTLTRIRKLRAMNAIKRDMENDLTDAYLVFVKFRIANQLSDKETGNHGGLSFIRPGMLGPQEQERLRKAMKAVEALQKYIQTVLLFGQAV
jgi:CBS domain-containing protein